MTDWLPVPIPPPPFVLSLPVVISRKKTMTTDPMIAHLTRTLAEVRARAEAAEADAASPWTASGGMVEASAQVANYRHYGDVGLWDNEGAETLSMSPKVAKYVASMDPATVLRMVAATEKLLELHPEHDVTKFADASKSSICDNCQRPWPCSTVKIEAERWGWTDGD